MKGKMLGTLLLILAALMVACTGEETAMNEMPEPTAAENESSPPVGTFWNLTVLNGADLVPGTIITAEFNEEGVVTGSSGCNNYIAGYEVDGDRITFELGSGATTRKMCPEPVMEQESVYLETLGAAATFSISGDQLTLYDANNSSVAVYTAVSQELAGSSWEVTNYNNGTGGVISVQAETQLTANFGEEGTLAGSAGCNEYTGPYEVEGNNISMGPFGTTRKLCPDPVMEQEGLYLAALETAATFKIEGQTMEIRTAEGATAVQFRRSSQQTGNAAVSGEVTNVDNAPIPEDATLTVQIQDTSKQDVAATVIGEQIIEDPGQYPIPYEVTYDPSDIASPRYTMSARITAADGNLLFINDTSIPVITNGATENVEIPVIQVGG